MSTQPSPTNKNIRRSTSKRSVNQKSQKFIHWVVAHPKSVIVCCLLLCTFFSSGISGISYTASPRHFQGTDSEPIKKLQALEDEYVQDYNILIMLKPRSSIVNNNQTSLVFTPEILGVIKEITDNAWSFPYVQRVDSISNFQNIHANGDDLLVEDLIGDTEHLTNAEINQIQTVALSEPRLLGLLIAPDGNAAGVNLSMNIDMTQPPQMYEIMGIIDRMRIDIEQRYPNLEIATSGYVDMAMAWNESIEKDGKFLYPATLLLIILSMIFFLRSLSATFAALLISILSITSALGALGHFGGHLYPPTVVGVLMILMLALADTIHVVKSVNRNLVLGKSKAIAITESIKFNFSSIALTSITTAIGFYSFAFSEFSATRVMGYYVAFGVILAWFLSITLLPALLSYCQFRPKINDTSTLRYAWLADNVIRYRKLLLLLTGPAVLASIYCLQLNDIDEDLARFINADQPFRQDMKSVEDHLTGSANIIYNFREGSESGLSKPVFMQQIDSFVTWIRQHPEVHNVASYTDTMKQLNKVMNNNDSAYYKLPDDDELAAQYLLFYQMSLPYGLDLSNQVNINKSATRVVITTNNLSAKNASALATNIEGWLQKNAPLLEGAEANGSSLTSVKLTIINMKNMLLGAVVAIFVIGIVLLFAFRAVVPGILSVIMVVSPIMATFGIWGLAVGSVGLSASIAICMIIGIVVDNAVHFINKFTYANVELSKSKEEAVSYAFITVGPALLTNAVVLISGFGVFAFSAFELNSTLGDLLVLSMATALVATFTLLPALLMIHRDKSSVFGFKF